MCHPICSWSMPVSIMVWKNSVLQIPVMVEFTNITALSIISYVLTCSLLLVHKCPSIWQQHWNFQTELLYDVCNINMGSMCGDEGKAKKNNY